MAFTIRQESKESKGSFFMQGEEGLLAEMTYSIAGEGLIIIDHTEVDQSLRGSGAGQALVGEAVAWARENKVKILPLCPFAHAVFQKNKDIQDVLK